MSLCDDPTPKVKNFAANELRQSLASQHDKSFAYT